MFGRRPNRFAGMNATAILAKNVISGQNALKRSSGQEVSRPESVDTSPQPREAKTDFLASKDATIAARLSAPIMPLYVRQNVETIKHTTGTSLDVVFIKTQGCCVGHGARNAFLDDVIKDLKNSSGAKCLSKDLLKKLAPHNTISEDITMCATHRSTLGDLTQLPVFFYYGQYLLDVSSIGQKGTNVTVIKLVEDHKSPVSGIKVVISKAQPNVIEWIVNLERTTAEVMKSQLEEKALSVYKNGATLLLDGFQTVLEKIFADEVYGWQRKVCDAFSFSRFPVICTTMVKFENCEHDVQLETCVNVNDSITDVRKLFEVVRPILGEWRDAGWYIESAAVSHVEKEQLLTISQPPSMVTIDFFYDLEDGTCDSVVGNNAFIALVPPGHQIDSAILGSTCSTLPQFLGERPVEEAVEQWLAQSKVCLCSNIDFLSSHNLTPTICVTYDETDAVRDPVYTRVINQIHIDPSCQPTFGEFTAAMVAIENGQNIFQRLQAWYEPYAKLTIDLARAIGLSVEDETTKEATDALFSVPDGALSSSQSATSAAPPPPVETPRSPTPVVAIVTEEKTMQDDVTEVRQIHDDLKLEYAQLKSDMLALVKRLEDAQQTLIDKDAVISNLTTRVEQLQQLSTTQQATIADLQVRHRNGLEMIEELQRSLSVRDAAIKRLDNAVIERDVLIARCSKPKVQELPEVQTSEPTRIPEKQPKNDTILGTAAVVPQNDLTQLQAEAWRREPNIISALSQCITEAIQGGNDFLIERQLHISASELVLRLATMLRAIPLVSAGKLKAMSLLSISHCDYSFLAEIIEEVRVLGDTPHVAPPI